MNILFITHNSSRAGAPYVLLLFLQWLRNNKTDLHITVLDVKQGPLHEAFRNAADEYHTFSRAVPTNSTLLTKVQRTLFKTEHKDHRQQIRELLAQQHYDVIYANTVKALPEAVAIAKKVTDARIIAHIHELRTAINLLLPSFKQYDAHIHTYIAVSNLVQQSLVDDWHIAPNKISQCYPFSGVLATPNQAKDSDSFIVGGAGKVDWRKGYDIFIQVARYVVKHHQDLPISFVWVGRVDALERLIIDADLRKLGLANRVRFVGEQQEPLPYFQKFDVFLMSSREDPFPLVCIEMAQLQKPLVCFENAVGTAEILKEGGGKIVPYLDIEAMANEVVFYYNNRSRLAKDGERARALFSEFTPDEGCLKLYEVIAHVANDAV